MTKTILALFAMLFAFSTPVLASGVIYQEEPAAGAGQPQQPQPEEEEKKGD